LRLERAAGHDDDDCVVVVPLPLQAARTKSNINAGMSLRSLRMLFSCFCPFNIMDEEFC
jgi:hypothetical protein